MKFLSLSVVQKRYPILVETISRWPPPRFERWNISGNLCNAVPLQIRTHINRFRRRLKLVGPKNRECFVEDFFKGPDRTVLDRTELVSEIQIPPTLSGDGELILSIPFGERWI